MLHMIEMQYSQSTRDQALDYFQKHGMTHYNGDVVIQNMWVCTSDHVAYALVDASSVADVENACDVLRQFGEVSHRVVIASDQL